MKDLKGKTLSASIGKTEYCTPINCQVFALKELSLHVTCLTTGFVRVKDGFNFTSPHLLISSCKRFLCMAMYVWFCMHGYVWLCIAMYAWLRTAMYAWLRTAMYAWLCTAMSVWLCMAMYSYVWLCMAMYS